ncbi:enolase superfamily member 1-like protein [Cricetulus griseus]|uniref:Enolase superfamily member 1-like protein n=1 Tax=Cricetulus griseus TaxID=10029 RepID=A0A061IHK4_CRIGR|nr:enolase superfamily member 1-like protein [Cricetulus griseus]
MAHGRISRLSVHDVRFPTSLSGHGSDAMHTDPDYSAAYVIIETDAEDGLKGYGITFTLGKGTEVDKHCCALFPNQLGPEKGVVHLATAAILNAVWDLWAKQEGKDPQMLLSCIDFRYITDVLTEKDAYEILKKGQLGKKERALCSSTERRLDQMMDANQCWDVPEAVEWMAKLAEFKPLWIEEPTSPDDILGHAAISKSVSALFFKRASSSEVRVTFTTSEIPFCPRTQETLRKTSSWIP